MMPMQFPAAPSLWVSDVAADRVAGQPLGGSSASSLASTSFSLTLSVAASPLFLPFQVIEW